VFVQISSQVARPEATTTTMAPSLPTSILLLFAVAIAFALNVTAATSPSPPAPEDGIRVVSAEKRIDLTGPIVKVFLTLKVHNPATSSDASHILITFTPAEAQHLAIVKATRAEGKRKKKVYVPLPVQPVDLAADVPNGARLYSVSLSAPLRPTETTTLEVFYVLTHSLEPFPAEIAQSESQLVYYRDSAVLLSPYRVLEQVTYLKTPSNRVESFTRVDPTARSGPEVKYGTYKDQLPYVYMPILVHYENNHPFAVVRSLYARWRFLTGGMSRSPNSIS